MRDILGDENIGVILQFKGHGIFQILKKAINKIKNIKNKVAGRETS